MSGLTAGWHDSDFIQDILALDHLAKYGIAPSLHVFARKVKEIVVGYVYEKLSSRRVRIHGACHGYGASIIFKTIVVFLLDRRICRFLLHFSIETAALDHKIVNDAVEDSAVVISALSVFDKVGNGRRRFFAVQFQGYVSEEGFH